MDLNPLYQLIISAIVMFGTEAVKRTQSIPINDGQKTRIRVFVAIASFVLTALTAWMDGHLESVLSPEILQVGVAAGASWLVAHIGYKQLLNK